MVIISLQNKILVKVYFKIFVSPNRGQFLNTIVYLCLFPNTTHIYILNATHVYFIQHMFTVYNTCLLYTTHVYFMQHMYLYVPHAVQEKLFGSTF
jgi:hypothetical protein